MNEQMMINLVMQKLSGMPSNDMTRNFMSMIQRQDYKGIEELGRNLCRERGIDPMQIINEARQKFGF